MSAEAGRSATRSSVDDVSGWRHPSPCLPSLGESCSDCHRCRSVQLCNCDGCNWPHPPTLLCPVEDR